MRWYSMPSGKPPTAGPSATVVAYGPRSAFSSPRNVAGPRIPSATRATERWNRATAFVVAGPYLPSAFPLEKPRLASARWRTATCGPVSPGLSVVAGAGSAVAVAAVGAVVARAVEIDGDVTAGAFSPPPLNMPAAARIAISAAIADAPTVTIRLSTVWAHGRRGW